MSTLAWIMAASVAGALLSVISAAVLALRASANQVPMLISYAIGALLGAVFLEILPHLQPGVWVHVHDIFFPADYPARWLVEQRLAFTEQYLLEAFLAFNQQFAVRAANHWLCEDHAEATVDLCPTSLRPDRSYGAGSFWMQRTLSP